ncbi:MAG TPA: trehalose-6-phosphate synthase [Egibacteraceae bacterium]
MSKGMIVASNRGPVRWSTDAEGRRVASRGFGGLVTALGGALQTEPGTWVSVALSEEDRAVADEHVGAPFEVEADGHRFRLRLLDVGERYERYYNQVSNRLLWFTVHQLWGEPYQPTGIGWRPAWEDYIAVNDEVARAVVAAVRSDDADEVYLQDYHLCLAPRMVREALPDTALLHYVHTPWVGPAYLGRLPDPIALGVLRGLLAADVVAFSAPDWAHAFRRCATELLGAELDGKAVIYEGHRTLVPDIVLGVDEDDLAAAAAAPATAEAAADLEAQIAGRKMILRVDRTDLSKNILRGLHAYELLLERHPEHRGKVWHYAHLNPSRQGVPEYRDYLEACRKAARRIANRFGEDAVDLYVGDDYHKAVAALQRYDVLLTNPVVDGTNLVAKEGPVLNRRDGVVVLSRSAGAANTLEEGALLVNPYDVEAQADALHQALVMPADERERRARSLAAHAREGAPEQWFATQRELLRQAVADRIR